MERLSESGNSDPKNETSGEKTKQKEARVLETIGVKSSQESEKIGSEVMGVQQSCSQEVGLETQGKENAKSENGLMGVKRSGVVIGGIRALNPVHVKAVSDSEKMSMGLEIRKDQRKEDMGLRRSRYRGEEEIEKGNLNSAQRESKMVDHVVEKENPNYDLGVEQMGLDLNWATMKTEEGGNGGPVLDQTVDTIDISSDETEDVGDQVANEMGGRREGKEIREGFEDGILRSFHGGCISMNGGSRYARRERDEVDAILGLLGIGGNRQDITETEVIETKRKRDAMIAMAAERLRQQEIEKRHRYIVRQFGNEFARPDSHYRKPLEKEKKQMQATEAEKSLGNFFGPFSIAMKLVKERDLKYSAQQLMDSKPLEDRDRNISMNALVPSLLYLSTKELAKNAEAIVSLEYVPDALKHRLINMLCDSRKMNIDTLELLVQGCPTEIRIKDCSWITEAQFTKVFGSFDPKNLKVLQLDLCGQCILGYSLSKTLARSPNSLPDLTIISLKGASRISNVALKELIASAPAIQSINLSQCTLLTDYGICILADSLGAILRELYIGHCPHIDAMSVAPAIKKFKCLEVLSVAGIQTVSDEFLIDIISECGRNMKELDLADCLKLTNISMEVIGNTCSRLYALNISNLHELTDLTIQYLANGCQSIRTLILRRNSFSDEAIAAFLETSGKSLKELSLNNVRKVGPNTALSLAKCSKELVSLDLSWCRKITSEELELIVDTCLSLKLLKLFGCTQISNEFLNGHSKSRVRIIGLNVTPLFEHHDLLEPDHVYLRYSHF